MLQDLQGFWTSGVQDGVILLVIAALSGWFFRGPIGRLLHKWFQVLWKSLMKPLSIPRWALLLCAASLVAVGIIPFWLSPRLSLLLALACAVFLFILMIKGRVTVALKLPKAMADKVMPLTDEEMQILKLICMLEEEERSPTVKKLVEQSGLSKLRVQHALDQLNKQNMIDFFLNLGAGDSSFHLRKEGRAFLINHGHG